MRAFELNASTLAKLLGEGSGDADRSGPTTQSLGIGEPEAQAMELLSRFDSLQHVEDFAPRDLAVEKPGVGKLPPAMKDRVVYVYVRDLDPSDEVDARTINRSARNGGLDRADCLVGVLTPGGSAVQFIVHCRAMLTHWKGKVQE